MIELMRTNDPVMLSFVKALLRDSGLSYFIADQNMSVIEGSLGILPRRVMVSEHDLEEARLLLKDAGIEEELKGE